MISVVVTLYNKENSILATVNSVLNQTCKDFELLIVNDGSTDKSLEVVSTINDGRLRIISKENGGVSSARNEGIRNSKGDYILLLDADDHISQEALKTLWELTIKYPGADIYTANYVIVENSEKKKICQRDFEGYVDDPYKMIWKRQIRPRIGNTIIAKEVFENRGDYSTSISLYEDLEFNMRILTGCRVVYSPKVILSYNREYSALSRKQMPIELEYCWHINLNQSPYYKKLLMSDNLNRTIYNKIKRGDFGVANLLLKRNIKHIPFMTFSLFYSLFIRLRVWSKS